MVINRFGDDPIHAKGVDIFFIAFILRVIRVILTELGTVKVSHTHRVICDGH